MLRMRGMGRFSAESGRAIAGIARRAVSVGNLEELRLLSRAVSFIESAHIRSIEELDALERGGRVDAALASYARSARMLPDITPPVQVRQPASRRDSRAGERQREAPPDGRSDGITTQQTHACNDRREER